MSRQAIDELLKKLMKQGHIRRYATHGETAEWLYCQSSVTAVDAAMRHQPPLSPLQVGFLNLLPPSGSVAIRDVRKAVPTYHGVLKRLIYKGLIEPAGSGSLKVVRLTPAGWKHESYQPGREHIASVNEASLLKPEMQKLLVALGVLEEARALDLTLTSGLTPNRGLGTAEHLRRLRVRGLISQHRRRKGRAFTYRLSAAGAELVAIAGLHGQHIAQEDAATAVEQATKKRAARDDRGGVSEA